MYRSKLPRKMYALKVLQEPFVIKKHANVCIGKNRVYIIIFLSCTIFEILFASLNSSHVSWNLLNKRLPRLFLLLLTAITLFHIVLLLDSFSLRRRDYFS